MIPVVQFACSLSCLFSMCFFLLMCLNVPAASQSTHFPPTVHLLEIFPNAHPKAVIFDFEMSWYSMGLQLTCSLVGHSTSSLAP